jgi:predicted nucleic acid-binding protein
MTLVDSNVPMYLVGAQHPHKVDARRWLEKLVVDGERLVSDAEVLQEILHRYTAIGRTDAISPALEAILSVVDEVFPVEKEDVIAARDTLVTVPSLSARDALHVAIMRRHRVGRILSFDRGFDGIPGIVRLG